MTPEGISFRAHMGYAAALVAISIAYYAAYITSGFNTADDGSYAQIAYELALGRDIHELTLNYGVLWFKLGEWFFRVFGVDYLVIKIFFFACLTATSVLVFHTVWLLSGNRSFATLVTAVPVLVPAFPATAFYGLCVMMNVAAQMNIATKSSRASTWDAAIAGIALSVSFQLRPDFGYIFVFPLLALLFLGGRERLLRLLGATAAGFVAAQVPLMVLAVAGGYTDVIWNQYASYPGLVLYYLAGGLESLAASSVQTAAGTVLQRPALHAILGEDGDAAALAMLVYLPIAVTLGFIALGIAMARQWWRKNRRDILGQSIVALSAAATLPHYFFFRPDLSHIANFMPGYVILVSAFIWQLYTLAQGRTRMQQYAFVAAITFLVGNLGVYVGAGLASDATGSIGIAAERTEHFTAANGVDVQVNAAEKSQLTGLKDIIEQNSRPGDAIVCFPYCPGIAFMTGRRMLFGNFFVDDSWPAREPDWLPGVIARTRAEKPPVVIVVDWAINGTDVSRFDVWAASYVAAVREIAREQRVMPGIAIYLL